MVVFFVMLFLVVIFGLAVLFLVAADAAGRAGGDQTQLAARLRGVLRHLNGEARPPEAIANALTPQAAVASAVQPEPHHADPAEQQVVAANEPPVQEPLAAATEGDDEPQEGRHLAA